MSPPGRIADKIVAREALPARLATVARPLVFTNGVFDLLHRGHVEYLEAARALGATLLVALNSDASARLLGKGADRPIVGEADRAVTIAALESVGLVTFFDERTPVPLLREVRPDVYVRGAAGAQPWRARTGAVVQRGPFHHRLAAPHPRAVRMSKRALFLDRDGVLNVDHGYVHRIEDFEPVAGVFDALTRAVARGWAPVVVTNQSGIGRGYYSADEYLALETHMRRVFAERGIAFLDIYHCPHLPNAGCACRKPAPGMILQAARDHDLDLSASAMIGDRASDAAAARAAGVGRVDLVGPGRTIGDIVADLCD
jgi:rfaE bifunctional protein nucleotidyltransferase chain/domain